MSEEQYAALHADLQRVRGALEYAEGWADLLPQDVADRLRAALTGHAEVSNPCPACKAAGFPECHGPHLTGPATGETE